MPPIIIENYIYKKNLCGRTKILIYAKLIFFVFWCKTQAQVHTMVTRPKSLGSGMIARPNLWVWIGARPKALKSSMSVRPKVLESGLVPHPSLLGLVWLSLSTVFINLRPTHTMHNLVLVNKKTSIWNPFSCE